MRAGTCPAGLIRVMIGGPGSGKTHRCLAELAAGRFGTRVSLDELRAGLGLHEHDQHATPAAIEQAIRIVRAVLAAGGEVTIDATSTTPRERATWLDLAREHHVPAVAEIVRTPPEQARTRNAARPRPVPDEVMRTYHDRVAVLTAQHLLAEGFAGVTEIITERGKTP